MIDCLRTIYVKQSRGFAHVAVRALVAMVLCCIIVKTTSRADKDAQGRLL